MTQGPLTFDLMTLQEVGNTDFWQPQFTPLAANQLFNPAGYESNFHLLGNSCLNGCQLSDPAWGEVFRALVVHLNGNPAVFLTGYGPNPPGGWGYGSDFVTLDAANQPIAYCVGRTAPYVGTSCSSGTGGMLSDMRMVFEDKGMTTVIAWGRDQQTFITGVSTPEPASLGLLVGALALGALVTRFRARMVA